MLRLLHYPNLRGRPEVLEVGCGKHSVGQCVVIRCQFQVGGPVLRSTTWGAKPAEARRRGSMQSTHLVKVMSLVHRAVEMPKGYRSPHGESGGGGVGRWQVSRAASQEDWSRDVAAAMQPCRREVVSGCCVRLRGMIPPPAVIECPQSV